MQYNAKLKNLKLLILQSKYKKISDIILKLTDHILYLESIYLIDQNEKNIILGNIYEINKNLNNINNNYLLTTFKEETNIDEELKLLLNDNINVDENLLLTLNPIIMLIQKKFIPFNKEEHELRQIMKNIGYSSIIDLINFFDLENVLQNFKLNNDSS